MRSTTKNYNCLTIGEAGFLQPRSDVVCSVSLQQMYCIQCNRWRRTCHIWHIFYYFSCSTGCTDCSLWRIYILFLWLYMLCNCILTPSLSCLVHDLCSVIFVCHTYSMDWQFPLSHQRYLPLQICTCIFSRPETKSVTELKQAQQLIRYNLQSTKLFKLH